MRLRRKQPDSRVDALEEFIYAQADEIIALGRKVSELEKGQHGHCLGCGDTTGHYSQTHCGRAKCGTEVA